MCGKNIKVAWVKVILQNNSKVIIIRRQATNVLMCRYILVSCITILYYIFFLMLSEMKYRVFPSVLLL